MLATLCCHEILVNGHATLAWVVVKTIPVVGSSLKLAHCVVFDILYEHFLGTC